MSLRSLKLCKRRFTVEQTAKEFARKRRMIMESSEIMCGRDNENENRESSPLTPGSESDIIIAVEDVFLDAEAGFLEEASSVSGGSRSEDGSCSYGYSSCQGKRATMEDSYDARISNIEGQRVAFFGVFDGHGGSHAAEYLKEHLFENLISHTKFLTETKEAITESYQKTDADFLQTESSIHRDDGSTASTAVLVGERLYVANVGDSRAVISKAGEAIPLSEDHKPNRVDERERIEQAGGNVLWAGTWRVGGVLAVSRAFGNRLLKQYVVAEPEIQETVIDEDLEVLVLASDGLWDVVTNEDAMSLVKSIEDPEVAARKLAETASTRGSQDNITCVVVRFHHSKPGLPC